MVAVLLVGVKALHLSRRINMRLVVIGVVTGACFCVLVLAVLGALAGYAYPDGFPPGLLPGVPRLVVGCLWALAYYGLLAVNAGAMVGGIVGGIAAGIRWLARRAGCQRAERRR
jgi:hypothetical protein